MKHFITLVLVILAYVVLFLFATWLYGFIILWCAQGLNVVFNFGWEVPMTFAARFIVGLAASILTGIFGGHSK